ncbi:hypothetical protein ACFQVC_08715 [Streptomyces monticola]|uniref:Uncharacterized protein n=1 Tax=Streptomyces monticola TaxID=2666263 RepID=A0ABW2JF34_9ACTN
MPKSTCAKSEEEAEADLNEYCEAIGFDPEWISPSQWAATLRIAQDKEYGYEQAHKTIDSDQEEIGRAAARKARRQRVEDDPSGVLALLDADKEFKGSLTQSILQQCADAYVAGQRVNLGLGGKPMDPEPYNELRRQWAKAALLADDDSVFTGFHSFPPQNKALVGKGNKGDTLDTRKVQGDLLVKIGGVKFNMHVDIAD